MKNLIKITTIIALFVAFSCSKSEENVPLVGSIEQLVLTSSSDDAILASNEEVTFTITGDGVDYSTLATLSVNQEEVTGNTYTFTEEGPYEVSASYLGANSNTISFNVIDSAGTSLLINGTTFLRNQEVDFSLINGSGEDVSDEATFFVDNTEIAGSNFTSATEGDFEVYAEYVAAGETFTTEAKEFSVIIPKKKVVVEDYTGTWCGFCPRVAAAIEEVKAVTNDVTIIAIHKTTGATPGPELFADYGVLEAEYEVGGLPQARIDRSIAWLNPHAVSDVTASAGAVATSTISINSAINGNELSVTANVLFENSSSEGDKIVVYVLENGLIYDQTNYYNDDTSSPYYQLGDPIPNFVHNEVLRQSMTATLGDAMPVTDAFDTYTKNLSITLPSEYVKDNLTIAVILVDSNNTAYNSQHAHVNEFKDFE